MIYAGVDPGAKGAIAWTDGDWRSAQILSFDGLDPVQLFGAIKMIRAGQPDGPTATAYLEENTGFIARAPRTGSSMYKFGLATGRVEMALIACGFALRRVSARHWQKSVGAPIRYPSISQSEWKLKLATFAREIAPDSSAIITRDNADAFLILRYAFLDSSMVAL